MFIIFYKDRDGKITHHQKAPEGWDEGALKEKIEHYNTHPEPRQTTTAEYIDVADGSIEKYLFEYAEKRTRYTKETIEAALDALDEARSCIDGLEVAK